MWGKHTALLVPAYYGIAHLTPGTGLAQGAQHYAVSAADSAVRMQKSIGYTVSLVWCLEICQLVTECISQLSKFAGTNNEHNQGLTLTDTAQVAIPVAQQRASAWSNESIVDAGLSMHPSRFQHHVSVKVSYRLGAPKLYFHLHCMLAQL